MSQGCNNNWPEVANAATPQEEPRVEAANVWAQTNFGCINGTRRYGAAIAFHRHCCAHVFGRYTPPERSQTGEQLQELQPGAHSPMNLELMKGLLAGVASVMSDNHQKTLTSALDRIATIVRPKLDVTGTAEQAEVPDASAIKDAEMVSQLLPSTKYMDQRIELLQRTSCGVVDEVQLPSARMWGIMEGQKRHEGWFKAVRWEEVQNEKRGKATWKDIQGELKVKTNGNVWVHPKLNETPPHQREYLFNHM